MMRSVWFRICAVAVSAAMFFSATAAGLKPVVLSSVRWIGLLIQGRPPQFTQIPRPIYYGPNPTRDPEFRGGIWTPNGRLALARAQAKWQREQRRDRREYEDVSVSDVWWLYAMSSGAPVFQPVPGGEGGGQMPGQGNLPGGGFYGATVNSATGNLNYPVPLFSIPVRGGMNMGLTLYHNSQTGFVGMFGEKWSCTWEMRVTDETSSVIVRWPDGLTVPYNPLPGGGYDAPPGIHDELVKNADGTWKITTKDQTVLNFGTDGRMTSVVDRNGNTITLSYSNGDLTTVTSPSGQVITFSYQTFTDQRRRCTSVSDGTRTWTFDYDDSFSYTRLQTIHYPMVDGQSFSTSFTYDSSNNLLTETDPKGKIWRWSYSNAASGVIGSFKDPLLNTWTFTFTASACALKPPENTSTQTIRHNYSNGLLVSVVDPANFSVSMQYDSDRNVTHFTDARGHLWLMTYDGRGNLTSVKNPFPYEKTWSFTWNAKNDLEAATDPLSHTWSLSYYPDGNLKEIWDPLSRRRALIGPYSNGLPSYVKDALDKQWTLGYDPNGYLNLITNPENETVSAVYDSLGRVTQVTNGAGETTKIYYDEWSRIKRIEHPDLHDIHYAYDAASNLVSVTDERDEVTTFAYDDAHRLISVTRVNSGENETESYAYDGNNRLTSVTNGNGKTRLYSYNVRGELYSISLPDLSTEYFSYDGDGNLTLYTHPEGFQIGYVYDNAGRLTKIDYPTGVDTTFSYDDASRLTQMVDSTGTTTWGYNNADQVTSLAQPAGTITYDYDDNARLWKMHQPGSLTTTYTYDFAWRLKQITNGYGEITTFDYDPASRVIKKSFANGTYETYSYDSRSRVEWIKLFNSSNQLLSQHQYTYDAASNVLTRTDNGVTTTFGYDDLGQLISESRPGYSASYTYDKNGNRLTRTVNGVTEVYTYDDADKLLNIKVNGVVVKSFTYDMAGRTTGITDSGGTTSYSWDYADRLVQITYPDQSINTFTYNGAGARVGKYDSSGTHTYLRTAATPWGDIVDDSAAIYTPSISERRNGATRFYHFGAHGEKRAETDSAGSPVATFSWDAFGNPTSGSSSTESPFRFFGAWLFETDTDSGFIVSGSVQYDPSTGRSLNPPSRSGASGGAGAGAPGGGRAFHGPEIAELAIPYLDGKPTEAFDATPWWQRALDGSYDLAIGWGDGVSGGLTFVLREWMGTNDYVDFNSGAYKVGVGIGIANAVAIDVANAATAARATRGVAGVADEVAEAACFVAGTRVMMADGTTKPIEEVKDGDWVLSRCEGCVGTVARPVSQTFSRSVSQTTTVRFDNGGEVVTTAEHPFWVEGVGWTAASRLTPADNVATPDGSLRVVSVVTTAGARVYNFEVSGTHTYFVLAGGEAVWVHNQCAKGPRPRGAGDSLPIDGGPPNGMLVSEPKPGQGTIREYDEFGRAKKDFDVGHDHGSGDPHYHDFIWKSPNKGRRNPVRGPARPPGPGE